EHCFEGNQVAVPAEACDDRVGDFAGDRAVAELLPRVDVGDVDLNGRLIDGFDDVTESQAVVRQSTGVDDHASRVLTFLLDEIDNGAFVIRLEANQFYLQLHGTFRHLLFDFLERHRPVY